MKLEQEAKTLWTRISEIVNRPYRTTYEFVSKSSYRDFVLGVDVDTERRHEIRDYGHNTKLELILESPVKAGKEEPNIRMLFSQEEHT